jgi:SAM-dependent methyltransferase
MSAFQDSPLDRMHDGSTNDALINWGDRVGTEARKSFDRWLKSGFVSAYLAGANILDVGYKGYQDDAHPILPWAVGIDLEYPGYDGSTLPFGDQSQDTVFNSHVLEHILDYRQAIRDWFRVLKVGGHLIIIVPHQFLYERMVDPPSRWNQDHKRFYTAASLLKEVEESLDGTTFRVRFLEDNDRGFDYSIPPEEHAGGCYEIILVIEKIRRPIYADAIFNVEFQKFSPSLSEIMRYMDSDFVNAAYSLILHRNPDPPGFDAYMEYLQKGGDRVDLLTIFADSEEAQKTQIPMRQDLKAYLAKGR